MSQAGTPRIRAFFFSFFFFFKRSTIVDLQCCFVLFCFVLMSDLIYLLLLEHLIFDWTQK